MHFPCKHLSDDEAKCVLLFSERAPSFRVLPHIIFTPFPELVDVIADVTGQLAGAWPLLPPYSSAGALEYATYPFLEWANPYNQLELQHLCRGGGDFALLINAAIEEAILTQILNEDFLRTRATIWPSVPHLVDLLGWVAIPTTHFSDIVFVCPKDKPEWATEVQARASSLGQDWSRVEGGGEAVVIRGYLERWHLEASVKVSVEQSVLGVTGSHC